MNGRRADHAGRAVDIFGPMADGNGNALGNQLLRGAGGIHVGAGDGHAHSLQHQAQCPHGNTADAHQMDVRPRFQIVFQFFAAIFHS